MGQSKTPQGSNPQDGDGAEVEKALRDINWHLKGHWCAGVIAIVVGGWVINDVRSLQNSIAAVNIAATKLEGTIPGDLEARLDQQYKNDLATRADVEKAHGRLTVIEVGVKAAKDAIDATQLELRTLETRLNAKIDAIHTKLAADNMATQDLVKSSFVKLTNDVAIVQGKVDQAKSGGIVLRVNLDKASFTGKVEGVSVFSYKTGSESSPRVVSIHVDPSFKFSARVSMEATVKPGEVIIKARISEADLLRIIEKNESVGIQVQLDTH